MYAIRSYYEDGAVAAFDAGKAQRQAELLRDRGIDAERHRKEHRSVGRIAIEEIAVVEIAIRAGVGDRFGRLMNT